MELAAKVFLVDLPVSVMRTYTYVEWITYMELTTKVALDLLKVTHVENVTSVEFAVHVMLNVPSVPHVLRGVPLKYYLLGVCPKHRFEHHSV